MPAGSRMRENKMDFGDQIKRFTENAKQQSEAQKKQVEQNAKQRLVEILGHDVALIKSIALDADIGKFYNIDAPQEVVDQLRIAGVVKE